MEIEEEPKPENKNSHRVRMSDDYELYSRTNDVSKRDTIHLLEEYSEKFQWKNNAKIIDIGCGDGCVTEILSTFLPAEYEELVGTDINLKAINYAQKHYNNKRIKFVPLDIEGEIPADFKERFDHLFSFYTFHWIKDQEKAFTNIHNILKNSGECFVMFLGYCQIYSILYCLYKSNKWSPYMKEFQKFASPYWEYRDPDSAMAKMLKKIGYSTVDVRCKQMTHMYNGVEHIKSLVSVISPFQIPKGKWSDFLDDFVETVHAMKLFDEETGKIQIIYNLLVVHCSK